MNHKRLDDPPLDSPNTTGFDEDAPLMDIFRGKKYRVEEQEKSTNSYKRVLYLTVIVAILLSVLFFYKNSTKEAVEDCELCKKSEQFNQEITRKEQEIIREKDKNETIKKQLNNSNNLLRDLGIQLDNIQKRKSIEV